MSEEVLGLRSTRARVRVGKVITPANQFGTGSSVIMTREGLVNVAGTLSSLVGYVSFFCDNMMKAACQVAYLDDNEASTGRVGASKVHGALITGNIKPLNTSSMSCASYKSNRKGNGGLHHVDYTKIGCFTVGSAQEGIYSLLICLC